MEQFANQLSYLSIFSALLPILAYLLFRSNYRNAHFICLLALLSLVADVGNELFSRSGQSGYVITNAFFIIQFLLLSILYYAMLKNKIWLVRLSILYGILLLADILFIQKIDEFQGWIRVFEAIVLAGYAISCYISLHNKPDPDKKSDLLLLWINMGVLFYFFFNLYLFSISNYVLKNMFKEDAMVVWGFHNVNNIVKNILFAIGLYESGNRKFFDTKLWFHAPW